MEVTFWIALIAGLVSFLSPCVLPLVPAYIGYMGGRMTHVVAAQAAGGAVIARPNALHRINTFFHGLAFVAGFTFVFVVIGLLGTAFVAQIGRQNITLVTRIISQVGGVIIILFGLHFMGVLPALIRRALTMTNLLGSPLTSLVFAALGILLIFWALVEPLLILPVVTIFILWLFLGRAFTAPSSFWNRTLMGLITLLYSDTRRQMELNSNGGLGSSAIMGVVFAAGWTPCIGPIYGSILTLAVTGTNIGGAAGLLAAYSLGLGIPFLATALLLDSASSLLRRLQRHVRKIELVSGAFLVLVGVAVASGRLQDWSQTFATQFADLSYRLEECAIDVTQGEIPLGSYFECVNTEDTPSNTGTATIGADGTVAVVPNTISNLADLAAAQNVPASAQTGLNVGDRAPDFSTTDADGRSIQLSDQRGLVVLLNFWATWCGPCRIEMPAFQEASAEYSDSLVILAVNNAETLDDILDFRTEFGLTFPLLLDESAEIQELFAVRAYPSTYIIDPDGIIRAQHFGPLTPEQIDQLILDSLANGT